MSVKHYPNLINAYELVNERSPMRSAATDIMVGDRHMWVPARAMGFQSWMVSLALAYGVFMGRYDALWWPGQGDK